MFIASLALALLAATAVASTVRVLGRDGHGRVPTVGSADIPARFER